MFEELSTTFTGFILVVSVFLSFVLRKLIQDIQSLKDSMAGDLREFTTHLVEEHPTLEKYLDLGVLYFKHELFEQALAYFERLLDEKVFLKEARYYQVLCLAKLGEFKAAREVFSVLDMNRYSKAEVLQLEQAFTTSNVFFRWKDAVMRILLTHVQYLPQRESASSDPLEQETHKIITSLPTRYSQVLLEEPMPKSLSFSAYDQHLERKVKLQVARSSCTHEELKIFLDYPKILARLHSRFFPEVYDLQQGTLNFYSQERFEGVDLYTAFSNYKESESLIEFLRVWLTLYGRIDFLRETNVVLDQFELNRIGIHAKRENLFISVLLKDYDRDSFEEILRVSFAIFRRHLLGFTEEKSFHEDIQELIDQLLTLDDDEVSIKSLLITIRQLQEKLFFSTQADTQAQMEQLGILEKIHRASVHGLKGKFSIVKRYAGEPEKLLRTFFRKGNVEDIVEKVNRLVSYKQELQRSIQNNPYGICDLIFEQDDQELNGELEEFFEAGVGQEEGRDAGPALQFLDTQYNRFLSLSNELSSFIVEHEIELAGFMELYYPTVVEQERTELNLAQETFGKKVRVLVQEEFREKLTITLDNLINNAYEAGASQVKLNLFMQDVEQICFVVEDDGPGVPNEILKELESSESYSLEQGGTGLLTAKTPVNR